MRTLGCLQQWRFASAKQVQLLLGRFLWFCCGRGFLDQSHRLGVFEVQGILLGLLLINNLLPRPSGCKLPFLTTLTLIQLAFLCTRLCGHRQPTCGVKVGRRLGHQLLLNLGSPRSRTFLLLLAKLRSRQTMLLQQHLHEVFISLRVQSSLLRISRRGRRNPGFSVALRTVGLPLRMFCVGRLDARLRWRSLL